MTAAIVRWFAALMTAKAAARPMWTEPALVSVCAWCPDARQRTAAAHAAGHDVTHGICERHAAEFCADEDGQRAA